jgi:hypothetical protein
MTVARRVGRAAAITLVAGTLGGAVVLATEAAVARGRGSPSRHPHLAR